MIHIRLKEKTAEYSLDDFISFLELKKIPEAAEYFDAASETWKPAYQYLTETEKIADEHSFDAMPGVVIAVLFLIMLNLFIGIFQFNLLTIIFQIVFIVGFFKRIPSIYWLCRGLMLLSAILLSLATLALVAGHAALFLISGVAAAISYFQFVALGTKSAKRFFKIKAKK